ncbi:MAG: hypothetical protein LBL90_06080 [Prevotellaceae bacterium]|jgi:hypothetical protein|nr:hypothetical protein [Prevotellaceae bacterium]
MMKITIYFIYACLIGLFLLLFACAGSDTPLLFSAIGTVESQKSIYLDTDKITVYTQNVLSGDYEVEVGDRVVVSFQFTNNTPDNVNIYVADLQKIPTDTVFTVTDDIADTLYVDTVTAIKRMWLSKDYLTVDFTYSGLDTSLHKFRLTKKLSENIPPADTIVADTIRLSFRHNSEEKGEGSQIRSLRSFKLSNLKSLRHDSILLTIRTDLSSVTRDTRNFYYNYK